LNSTRDERKLKRYEDVIGVWKIDCERISKRLKRTVKESVFARCDAYREILEKLESSKPLTDVLGSSYAFKMTLRSGRKSTSYAHYRLPIELPDVKNDYYGDVAPKTTNRTVRFKSDESDASTKPNNKSASFSFSERKFCVNDSIDLLQRRLK
jgi:hypothetical protein